MPEFVCITNHDNYYMPGFLDLMLSAIDKHDGAYCDMIYNYKRWIVWPARLQQGRIDCGSVIARSSLALRAGFLSRRHAADWDWILAMLNISRDFVRVPLPLFVHN